MNLSYPLSDLRAVRRAPVAGTDLLQRLGACFFDIVPLRYRTYCTLTARIVQVVLRHYGQAASLLPCQLWCITPANNYVVGFVDGLAAQPGKWNGHVICVSGGRFIDAAVHQLKRDFDISGSVPNVVIGKCFGISSHAISRADLGKQAHLLWLTAPQGQSVALPPDSSRMVDQLAGALIDHLDGLPLLQ